MFNGFREHKVTPDRAPSIPTPTPPEAGGAGKDLMDTLFRRGKTARQDGEAMMTSTYAKATADRTATLPPG